MYIVTCVYNTLSRWARRIIDKMKSLEVQVNVAMLIITLGFSAIVTGIALNSSTQTRSILVLAGAICFIGGLFYVNRIYKQIVDKEDEDKGQRLKEEKQRHKELLDELKGIRKDLNTKNQGK